MTEPLELGCPRCGAARTPEQEFCLECGLRLPTTTGPLARARRGWVRRIGWYPGDWIWTTLLALVVAAVGAALAILTTSDPANSKNTGTTFVLTSQSVPLTTPTVATVTPTVDTSTLPTPPEPPTTTTKKPKPKPEEPLANPSGKIPPGHAKKAKH